MDPENYVNDFNQFIDKRAFPGVEADHGALNGYMIAEEVLEDLCLDGKENWQKFLEEFKADFDRAAGRLPKLPEVSDQMLLGHLQAQRERINHLLVDTFVFGDPIQQDLLPGSVAEPDFFDKMKQIFERMQASGELAAREEAYRQDANERAEVLHSIEDDIRRSYENAQRKVLLDAVGKTKEEGDAALADAAVLRQTQYQDAARRQANRLRDKLQEIGNQFRAWYEKDKEQKSNDYLIHTSQEWDALERAAADGHRGKNYVSNAQSGTRSHVISGLSHFVQLALTPEEIAEGVGLESLRTLTEAQDADCIFALFYVSSLLLPSEPQEGYAGGWIDLNDVMDKIGWKPRSTEEREEMRKKVFQYLKFGSRAQVMGRRSIPYKNPKTGEVISTDIETPLWAFMGRQSPTQQGLFPSMEVPVRLEIVLSKEWLALMSNPHTAQYLPLGEMLGAIPGNKPGGAWARTMGLSLAGFWRRGPRETLAGTRQPTRGELLTRFLPKKATPQEVLNGANPARAIEYWHGALRILVELGFIANEGEAATELSLLKKTSARYDWQEEWLKAEVQIKPGLHMREPVRLCAENLPPIKPRNLAAPARRGRPRKAAPSN